MIAYAEQYGIPIKASLAKPYSEDENLFHISHEAGILEDISLIAPESVYSITKAPKDAPDVETLLEVHFKDGTPIKVVNRNDGTVKTGALDLFLYLNEVGSANGVGRIDIVENRYVGIKSRGVYETPGGTILWAAHRDLEAVAMDKEVMHIRDSLVPKFSEIIYNGFWFSPEMDFLLSAFTKSQEAIDGVVTLCLYKGNCMVVGRESPTSLYDQDLSSMEIEGGYDHKDADGFIKINAVRLKAHAIVIRKQRPYAWRRQKKNGS